jgi:hypothetical protein
MRVERSDAPFANAVVNEVAALGRPLSAQDLSDFWRKGVCVCVCVCWQRCVCVCVLACVTYVLER